MDDEPLRVIGKLLAERHSEAAEPLPERSVLNYGESARSGDWSLRSALTRLAQPEPVRAAAVLQLVRRLEVALHPLIRSLEKHIVICDRALAIESLNTAGLREITEPAADARCTDLARVLRTVGDGFAGVLAGYSSVAELSDEEYMAIPLLVAVLEFDDLAERLTEWACAGPENPPVDAVDTTSQMVRTRLDALGVPEETRRPRPGRGGSAQ